MKKTSFSVQQNASSGTLTGMCIHGVHEEQQSHQQRLHTLLEECRACRSQAHVFFRTPIHQRDEEDVLCSFCIAPQAGQMRPGVPPHLQHLLDSHVPHPDSRHWPPPRGWVDPQFMMRVYQRHRGATGGPLVPPAFGPGVGRSFSEPINSLVDVIEQGWMGPAPGQPQPPPNAAAVASAHLSTHPCLIPDFAALGHPL